MIHRRAAPPRRREAYGAEPPTRRSQVHPGNQGGVGPDEEEQGHEDAAGNHQAECQSLTLRSAPHQPRRTEDDQEVQELHGDRVSEWK